MKAIKSVREEVITDTIATPFFTPSGVGRIPFGGSPAHSQVSRFCCHEWLGVVHHELIVPLLILSRPFTDAQKNIGPHALKRQEEHVKKGQGNLLVFSLMSDLDISPASIGSHILSLHSLKYYRIKVHSSSLPASKVTFSEQYLTLGLLVNVTQDLI
jgi:hypothetical protein